MQKWQHPGGKLRELGADSLTDSELLAILISTGTKGKTAEEVAKEIIINLAHSRAWQTSHLRSFLRLRGLRKYGFQKTNLTSQKPFQNSKPSKKK